MTALRATITALVLLVCAAPLTSQVPANPGFELGTPGERPQGWSEPAAATARAFMDTTVARSGRASLRMEGSIAPGSMGNALQRFDATALRGQRVRFTGWARTQNMQPTSRLMPWLRVDREGNQQGFLDNYSDRPIILASDWVRFEIIGDVATDATSVFVGAMLQGAGVAWVDDVAFDVLGPTPPRRPEPARPLSERGLENLTALARLIGYVRHFHPSDGAVATNWDHFTIAAVRAVEDAADARQLTVAMRRLLEDVAPAVLVIESATAADHRTIAQPAGADRLRQWRHEGLGSESSPMSTYRSVRLSHPLAAALPDSMADPRTPLLLPLGGGVSAVLPLSTYADAEGTLPRSRAWTPPAGTLPPPTRGGTTGDDRATRLAAVILAWNVFQHFYPYFDVVETDWAAELPRALGAAAVDADAEAFMNTLRRMVAALHDGHGNVTQPDIMRNLALPGVDAAWIEGQLVITAVAGDVSGVARGDVVLEVDGVPVAAAMARESELVSSATPQHRRVVAVNRLLMGRHDQPLRLRLRRSDGSTAEVTLPRDGQRAVRPLPPPVAEVAPGIWYVDIDRITDAEFAAARPQLAAARGLIFDLRGYPRQVNAPELLRHLISGPATSAQWHVPLVVRPDREGMTTVRRSSWQLTPAEPHFAAPRVFLTGGGSISYAESVMGIIEHYRLAEIVGEATAGTNGNVNPIRVPGDYNISWTGMKVLKQDGSVHHGVGIAPTVPVSRTVAGVAAGEDEVLQAAIRLLTERR